MTSVGDGGWCWSSSSYAAGNRNAGSLNFNTSNVNPLNNDNRANGFVVRCVQHLRGCLPRVKARGARRFPGPALSSSVFMA
ncbi:MAG: hypothetical protein K2I13_03510 [Alistipes sp.]|nr:hypothetical protein [Alistipes sp.]